MCAVPCAVWIGKVLFLGLDNAGKTTLLGLLKTGIVQQFTPTGQPTNEEIAVGNVTITAHDLGGHPAGRKLWTHYYAKVAGIAYLVRGTALHCPAHW